MFSQRSIELMQQPVISRGGDSKDLCNENLRGQSKS